MHGATKLKKNQNCPQTFSRSSAHGGNIAAKMSLRKCGGRCDVSGGNRSKPEIIFERNLCKDNYIIVRLFNKINNSQITGKTGPFTEVIKCL